MIIKLTVAVNLRLFLGIIILSSALIDVILILIKLLPIIFVIVDEKAIESLGSVESLYDIPEMTYIINSI